jgi:hypothetical protein
MYQILLGGDADKLLIVVLKPSDLEFYRKSPADNGTRIDLTKYGRPGVAVIMTYADTDVRMQEFVQNSKLRAFSTELLDHGREITVQPGDNACLTGFLGDIRIIGYVMSKASLDAFEKAPMETFITLKGGDFGVTGFSVMIIHAVKDRRVVSFLREMNMPMQDIAAKLPPLFEGYIKELLDACVDVAGQQIDIVDEPVKVTFGQPGKDGAPTEEAMLAARAQELEWFKLNPTKTHFYRQVIPGELPAECAGVEWVRVIRTEDSDYRFRVPVVRVDDGNFVEFKGRG